MTTAVGVIERETAQGVRFWNLARIGLCEALIAVKVVDDTISLDDAVFATVLEAEDHGVRLDSFSVWAELAQYAQGGRLSLDGVR